tara:strand:- start:1037 stop:1564 length:528 start_codon:yes stop_codon:yes gene_type:complete
MADGIVNIRGKDYITVPKRMAEFRKEHTIKEGWAVVTECQDIPDKIRVKAMILNPAGMVVATGHAEEKPGSNPINKTNAIENCETSAVGRALAMCGYGGESFASAEDMAQVQASETPIDQALISDIESKAKEASIDIDRINARYGVQRLQDLSQDAAKEALRIISKQLNAKDEAE